MYPLRASVVLAATLACVSCGDDGPSTPVAPSPPPPAQIAGNWTGTFESQTYTPEAITMNLNQIGGTITGTWAMGSGVRAFGNVNGTVDASNFVGTITYNYSGGPTCSGSFSGPATATTLNWSSPGFTTGDCGLRAPGNPLGVRFVLQRR